MLTVVMLVALIVMTVCVFVLGNKDWPLEPLVVLCSIILVVGGVFSLVGWGMRHGCYKTAEAIGVEDVSWGYATDCIVTINGVTLPLDQYRGSEGL